MAGGTRERGLRVTALLVSVRGADEVVAALEGGAEVLDLKAPERGSLGLPDNNTMEAVLREQARWTAATGNPTVPLSLALGEAWEWLTEMPPAPAPRTGWTYLKLGTARLGQAWEDDYRTAWQRITRVFGNDCLRVAVAYADHALVEGPAPEAVLDWAIHARFDGFLIDTAAKGDSGGLFAHLDLQRLGGLQKAAESARLTFAVAGKLTHDDTARLRELGADLVGIRSAACLNGQRNGSIVATRVSEFRALLERDTVRVG